MRITRYALEAIEEPIKAAFGFKGRSLARPMWNTAVRLHSERGYSALGLSNQGILWSDAAVHGAFSYTGGNALMYLMSEYALKRSLGIDFSSPGELNKLLLPEVWDYGRRVSGFKEMRETFALNALVALDTAAWLLFARENGIDSFDGLIPEGARRYMSARHEKIAAVPILSYSSSMDDLQSEVEGGSFFIKIKIGNDPEGDGDYEKMLKWDKERLRAVHERLKDIPCPYSDTGHIPYYLDANGRYPSMDYLLRLLDGADSIGALSRIALLEEPFCENAEIDVSGLPVCVAADESAHSDADVNVRIDMGYGAIALKPIAKTISMTFDMIEACGKRRIPCFCADLTVNAWMADLNKNFAARLKPVSGLKTGVIESNGHQYYSRWNEMCAALPYPQGAWVHPVNGLYELDDDFYTLSGGIFGESRLYEYL